MKMIQINIVNQTSSNIDRYTEVITNVFKTIESSEEMNVIFLDSEQMRALNQQFRKMNKTTDVLTFPSDDVLIESIGDVFINIDKVREQALEYDHSEDREVAFLAIHGYLHILGYDHHTKEEEKLMIEKQRQILSKAGLERK